LFSNSEYQELEADHRRTLQQLESVREAYSLTDDELDEAKRAIRAVVKLFENMMGADDMEEVQEWLELPIVKRVMGR
jgi:5-bromo-4-chloroindolyl phosphate hydrolysis protein